MRQGAAGVLPVWGGSAGPKASASFPRSAADNSSTIPMLSVPSNKTHNSGRFWLVTVVIAHDRLGQKQQQQAEHRGAEDRQHGPGPAMPVALKAGIEDGDQYCQSQAAEQQPRGRPARRPTRRKPGVDALDRLGVSRPSMRPRKLIIQP